MAFITRGRNRTLVFTNQLVFRIPFVIIEKVFTFPCNSIMARFTLVTQFVAMRIFVAVRTFFKRHAEVINRSDILDVLDIFCLCPFMALFTFNLGTGMATCKFKQGLIVVEFLFLKKNN